MSRVMYIYLAKHSRATEVRESVVAEDTLPSRGVPGQTTRLSA